MLYVDYVIVDSSGKAVSAQIKSVNSGHTMVIPITRLYGTALDNAVVSKNGIIRAKKGTLERVHLKSYFLMNKNKVVAEFDDSFSQSVRGKLPIGYESIQEWITERRKFRCAVDGNAFFLSVGMQDLHSYIDKTNCISLSDTFWVKSADSSLVWSDISPFRNKYSKVISTYSLEGYLVGRETKYLSPDISSTGSFPHTWQYNNGNVKFVKAGSKYSLGGANSGFEPFSEYFASLICNYLDFNHIKYGIKPHTRRDGNIDIVTECDCYTSESKGAVSAARLGLKNYDEVLKYCETLGESSIRTCLDMYFLDCLLLNVDRHLGNIEFYVNNETQKVIEMIPIYDNNNSMLPRFIESMDTFVREEYISALIVPFDWLFKLVLNHRSYRKELNKLKRLKLEKPNGVALSDSRLNFMNKFLQMQVNYLLSLC